MPQAAIDLEQKIKESMIELSKIKKRSIDTLEAEEELKAAEEKRPPKSSIDLMDAEENRVKLARAPMEKQLKEDRASLEKLYPEATKNKAITQRKIEADKALNIISTLGDKLTPAQIATYTAVIDASNADFKPVKPVVPVQSP